MVSLDDLWKALGGFSEKAYLECSSRNVSAPEPGYVGTAVASCLVDRYFSDSQGVCITRSELNGNRWQCKWFCVIGRFRWFQRRGDSCFLEFDHPQANWNNPNCTRTTLSGCVPVQPCVFPRSDSVSSTGEGSWYYLSYTIYVGICSV